MKDKTTKNRKIPLYAILTFLFGVLIIFTAVLTAYIAYNSGEKVLGETTNQLYIEIENLVDQHLDSYLGTAHHINQINSDAMRSGMFNSSDKTHMARYFWQEGEIFQGIGEIAFAGADGDAAGANVPENYIFIAGAFPSGRALKLYSAGEDGRETGDVIGEVDGYDPRTRGWYKTAVSAGEPAWTEILPSASRPRLDLTAVSPYYGDEGLPEGVFFVDVSLERISDFLAGINISSSGQIVIIDSDGYIVASSTAEKPFVNGSSGLSRLKASCSSEPVINQTAGHLEDAFPSPDLMPDSYQSEIDISGERYFVSVSRYNDDLGLDWLTVIAIPESDIMAYADIQNRETAVLIIILLAVSSLTAVMISRWITRPITELSRSAGAFAEGDWGRKAEIDRNDEIGELADSFNKMSGMLRESFDALKQSEEKYRGIVSNSKDIIYTLDFSGKITSINPAVSAILGYSPEQATGKDLGDYLTPESFSLIMGKAEECRSDAEKPSYYQIDVSAKDGRSVSLEINSMTITLADGKEGILGVARDITERKKSEDALRMATKKLSILNSITFTNIQNALFALSGYLEVEDFDSDPKRREHFRRKELGIIDSLTAQLDYSKHFQELGVKPAEWQNVNTVFLMAVSHLKSTKKSVCEVDSSLEIFADPLFERVIFNLAENVFLHAPDATGFTLSSRQTKEGMELVFEDDGAGIPFDMKEEIFREKTGPESGFGLFFVKEVLAITGISIHETGEPKSGARFEMLVPEGAYRFRERNADD